MFGMVGRLWLSRQGATTWFTNERSHFVILATRDRTVVYSSYDCHRRGVRSLLDGQNFSTVCTFARDGSVQAVPTWVDTDGEYLLLNSVVGHLGP